MRTRSLFTLVGVMLLFLVVQGWFIAHRYWMPKTIHSVEARIEGKVVDVGTPVMGTVEEVYVYDAQRVEKGDRLFLIVPVSQDHPFGGVPMEITSPQAGVIAQVTAVPGKSIQASERLAKVIDLSPDARFVTGTFPIDPGDHARLKAFLPAQVRAPYILDNEPISAMVTGVEPMYNADTGTVRARLRITGAVPPDAPLTVGLPVQVTLEIENDNKVKDWIRTIVHAVVPTSVARKP